MVTKINIHVSINHLVQTEVAETLFVLFSLCRHVQTKRQQHGRLPCVEAVLSPHVNPHRAASLTPQRFEMGVNKTILLLQHGVEAFTFLSHRITAAMSDCFT